MTSSLHKRPYAATYAIEDLVPLARKGTLRLPSLQRLFKWQSTDVRDFFDSIYRGFPIGTLLLWKKPAEAGRFQLGPPESPVDIDAPAQTDALWMVDGQQRISSLVGVLAPSGAPSGVFHLHFDLAWEDAPERERPPTPFIYPDARRAPKPTWLPMHVVLDSEALEAWFDESGVRGDHPEYVRRARRLNKLIREYKVPAYIVEAGDAETLGLIFERVNNAGRRLDRSEVFNALLRSSGEGDGLPEMSQRARDLGFGELDQDLLLKVVLAIRGLDITTTSGKRLHEIPGAAGVIRDAEPALRKAVELLRRDARIPHEALLPYRFPIIVLARFFRSHPKPLARSRALLSRWVWRGAITGEHSAESRPAVRAVLKGLDTTEGDEEAAVQMLLASMPRVPPAPGLHPFRFGTAQSKLDLLALSALGPRDLVEGVPLDVGPLLAEHGARAIVAIMPGDDNPAGTPPRTLGNLLIQPPIGRRVLMAALVSASPEVLMSHGIDAEAGDALRQHNIKRAIELREARLRGYVASFLDAHARWNETDRPSLARLGGPEDDEETDDE